MTNSAKNALTLLVLSAVASLALLLVLHGLTTLFGILTPYGFAAAAVSVASLAITVVFVVFAIELTRHGLGHVPSDATAKLGRAQVATYLSSVLAFAALGAALGVTDTMRDTFLDSETASAARTMVLVSAVFPSMVIARGWNFWRMFPFSFTTLVATFLVVRIVLRLQYGPLAEIAMGCLVALVLCLLVTRAFKALKAQS